MSERKYKGYHTESLPFKPGTQVQIPAGTKVRSTNPQRREYTTKRAQRVTVRSVMCGQSFPIGLQLNDGTRRGYFSHREDVEALEALYGSRDPQVLVNHPDAYVQDKTVFLPVQDPAVCWAGMGSYWCEVNINDLLGENQ